MRRKGFVFTLDALLSLVLVVIFVTSIISIQSQSINVYSTYIRSQNAYTAQNVLELLRTTPLENLVPSQKIEDWISNGILNSSLVNPTMSPLEIAATYWAASPVYPSANLTNKAEIILGYILNNTLKGYNYQLIINNYTSPYLSKIGANYVEARDVSASTISLTGYAYNQTPRGYMARAYLTKLGSKENLYILRGGYIESAAPSSSEYVVIKYIIPRGDIPSDAQIQEIKWFIEPAWTDSYYRLFINGNPVTCNGYYTWNYVQYNDEIIDTPTDTTCNLIENFDPNRENIFEVWVYNPYYGYSWYSGGYVNRGGEDGAQRIIINYTTTQPTTLQLKKKVYLEDVSSYYGIELWKFLFVPGKLNSMEIQVAAGNVSSTMPISLRFMLGTSADGILINPTSCSYDSVNRIKTCYWDNSTLSTAIENSGYDYRYISAKTTVVKVFIGDKDTYYNGYRVHLIGSQSYINLDYVSNILLSQYSVDITKPLTNYVATNCNSYGYCSNIEWTFDIPNGTQPLWAFIQNPWLYYTGTDPYQKIEVDSQNITPTYIHCYGDSCVPSSPFIHLAQIGYMADTFDWNSQPLNNAISTGTNTLSVDLGYGYYLQPSNGQGEFTYLIQAYAGYGKVFPKLLRGGCNGYNITYYWVGDTNPHYIYAGTSPYCNVTAADLLQGRTTYAVDDAIIRLFNNLGGDGTSTDPIQVELPSTVNIEFANMGNIPSGLFTPVQMTLRVWRER